MLMYGGLTAAVVYFYPPIFIFISGWLRWPIAVILTLTTASLLYNFYHTEIAAMRRRLSKETGPTAFRFVRIYVFSTLALAALGTGGLAGQAADWTKHNMILQTLISEEWPVIITLEGAEYVLSYYVAYYLPAAVVGKLFGWAAANIFLLLYSALGLTALIALMSGITRASVLLVSLIIFSFSGFDVFGSTVILLATGDARFDEWWAHSFQYTSNIIQIFFVPQIAISGWIMASLIYLSAKKSSIITYGSLLLPASLLWSPFLTLGIAPFVTILFFREVAAHLRGSKNLIRKPKLIAANLVSGILLCAVLSVYYYARFEIAPVAESDISYREYSPIVTRFQFPAILGVYVLFVLLEVGIWAALVLWARQQSRWGKAMQYTFATAVAMLLLIPLLPRYGYFNDLVMKISVPISFVMLIFVLKAAATAKHNFTIYIFGLALTVSAINAMISSTSMIVGRSNYQERTLVILKEENVRTLPQLHATYFRRSRMNFAAQYLGGIDSTFSKYLARRPMTATHTATEEAAPKTQRESN